MLDIGVYNALLCRIASGPLIQENLELMVDKEHPCIDFLQKASSDYYIFNNFVSLEVPTLSQGGRFTLPRGFPCCFYNSQELVEPLDVTEDVHVISVVHQELRRGVFEPWVIFSMDNGRQGEFSLNIFMRSYARINTSEE